MGAAEIEAIAELGQELIGSKAPGRIPAQEREAKHGGQQGTGS